MVRLRNLLVAAALLTGVSYQAYADKLVLMHTNDTHSQIDPDHEDMGGVIRRKALIDSIRQANENTLLIDCGDIVQGTLFFNIYKGEVEEKVMNALGYDLRILGNHEFDNGMQSLADNLKNADAQLLVANYQMDGTPLEGLFEPYSIYEYGDKRIAFMPVNLNPVGMISSRNFEGMGYIDAVDAANNMAWFLKHILQADMVVAITHIGYESSVPPSDVDLIKSSRDIDLVLGGHSHTKIDPEDPESVPYLIKNAEGRDIVVAQTGRRGAYLGEVVIDLDDLTAQPKSRLIPVDRRLDDLTDADLVEMLQPYRAKINELNSHHVGKTTYAISKDSQVMLNFATDLTASLGRQLSGGVDFALLNKGSLRTDLPKGDISEGDIIRLIPFDNHLQVIDIKGADLMAAFEVMAKTDGNGVSREVQVVYDPVTKEVVDVKISGKPLDPDKTYRVALSDYLAQGGDYMVSLRNHTLVAESPGTFYEDIVYYLSKGAGKGKKIDAPDRNRWTPRIP